MVADGRFVVVGLIVGALVGFTGMGGGAVTTPLLILFGLPPVKAIGSDLVYSAITKTVGSASHARQRNVDWRVALWLAAGSVPASVLGVFTSRGSRPRWAPSAQGADAGAARRDADPRRARRASRGSCSGTGCARGRAIDGPVAMTRQPQAASPSAIGAVGGFGVGLTSIGSGTLFAIVLITTFPLAGAARRRHRRLPRGAARVGGRARPRGERQRPVRHGRRAARRLGPGRADRLAVHRRAARAAGAARARLACSC